MLANRQASLIAVSQGQPCCAVLQSLCCGADLFAAKGLSSGAVVNGYVRSCFEQAIHISLDDGRLLTLLCGTTQYSMRLINVAEPVWERLHQLLVPNDVVTIIKNTLQHKHFTLVWQAQTCWHSPTVATCLNNAPSTVLSKNLKYAQQWLADELVNKGTDKNLLWQSAYANFLQVVNALNDNTSALETAVYNTVGLGLGLTPSGDDMLAGLLLGLITEQDKTHSAFSRLSELIAQYATQTTYASQDSFDQAIQGWLTARLAEVLLTLNSTDTQALTRALSSQAAIGHHSGLDSLIGLFAGLAFVLSLQAIDPFSTSLILSA